MTDLVSNHSPMKQLLCLLLLVFTGPKFLAQSPSAGMQRASVQVYFSGSKVKGAQLNVHFLSEGLSPLKKEMEASFSSNTIEVPLKNSTPFFTLAAVWEAENFSSPDRIEFRTMDNKKWSPWYTFKEDEHSQSKEDWSRSPRSVSDLHFLDQKIKFIQYRIIFSPKSKTTVIKSLRLDFFSPGDQKKSGENPKQERTLGTAKTCTCPPQPFSSRKDWNCPDGDNAPSWTPQLTTFTNFVVHHQAGTANAPYSAVVLSIWNQHTYTNGWGDIGYNWLIAPDGSLYQGRAWSGSNENVIGAHMCGCNSNKMGVCMLGNLMTTPPTPEAYNKLVALLAWKACTFSVEPLLSTSTSYKPVSACTTGTVPNIIGHRDGCPPSYTECPGDAFYKELKTLRTDVEAYISSCSSPCTAPANDGCAPPFTPVSLNMGASCNPVQASSCGASSSGFTSCQGIQDDDVFFSFIPDSSSVNISVSSSQGYDAVFQLLSGPCGGGMSQLLCVNNTGQGGIEKSTLTGLQKGSTYYIRVWNFGYGYGSGDFSICAYNTCVPPPQPGPISGNTNACQGVQTTYTIANVPGAKYYTWVLPKGWSGSSSGTSITVLPGISDGTLLVTANDSCGSSKPQSLAVKLNATIDTSVSIKGNTLQSNTFSGTYQWIDCVSKQKINGATQQSYTPVKNGMYAVVVTQNNCTDTSRCYAASTAGIHALMPGTVSVHPNPAEGIINITGSVSTDGKITLVLCAITGQVLLKKEINTRDTVFETQIDLSAVVPGMYFLSISSGDYRESFKIRKQ